MFVLELYCYLNKHLVCLDITKKKNKPKTYEEWLEVKFIFTFSKAQGNRKNNCLLCRL